MGSRVLKNPDVTGLAVLEVPDCVSPVCPQRTRGHFATWFYSGAVDDSSFNDLLRRRRNGGFGQTIGERLMENGGCPGVDGQFVLLGGFRYLVLEPARYPDVDDSPGVIPMSDYLAQCPSLAMRLDIR